MLNLLILSYHLKVITELIFFHCAIKEVLITLDLMRHIEYLSVLCPERRCSSNYEVYKLVILRIQMI